MNERTLEATEVAQWIQNLSDQDFITFFYTHMVARHIYPDERRTIDSSLVLANSKRSCTEGEYVGPWQLELIAPGPQERWHSNAPLRYAGVCGCGHNWVSISQTAACPACNEYVYAGDPDTDSTI